MNIPYAYSSFFFEFTNHIFCLIDDLNIYECPETKPRHFSILVDDHDYRKEYSILVGGVIVYRPENFELVNGYSNLYWGWGAEDDEMFIRLKKTKIMFDRPQKSTKYKMLTHGGRV